MKNIFNLLLSYPRLFFLYIYLDIAFEGDTLDSNFIIYIDSLSKWLSNEQVRVAVMK